MSSAPTNIAPTHSQRRTRARRTPGRVAFALVAGALAASALTACSNDPAPKPKAAAPTPITQLDTSTMSIPRIDFCELLPEKSVDAALGVTKWQLKSVGNGDEAAIGMTTEATSDVVSEHLCTFSPTTGASRARAWTFAPPTTPAMARSVIAQARRQQGCRIVKAPAFGSPSMAQICQSGPGTRVRFAGLFTDTWLTCEVTDRSATVPQVRARAGTFCVDVTQALNTAG